MKYAIAAALIIGGLLYMILVGMGYSVLGRIPGYGFAPIFIGLGILLWGAEWTDF